MMEIVTSIVLLILGITLLVTIHICIVGRAFGIGRGSDHGNNNNNNGGNQTGINTRSQRMSQDDIKKLPCFDYKGVEEAEEDMIDVMNGGGGGGGCECSSSKMNDCVVCLENFKVGDKCRLLPKCRHSFHAQCIDSWLVKNGACPICRTGADDDQIELKRSSGESSRNSIEVRGVSIEMV